MVRRTAVALFFAVILACSLSFPDTPVSELSYKSVLVATSNSTNISIKLTYFNLTYYYKPKPENAPVFPNIVPGDYSEDEYATEIGPLNGSLVFFTFDGKTVSQDGAHEACNPAKTDKDGRASCNISYIWNPGLGHFESFDTMRYCGSVNIEYRGETRGPDDYKPSTKVVDLCPRKNAALSAFGPALYIAITKPENVGYCFPAMLILGILVASMYYSGRDPLSLFDLTTPRLPKTRQQRVSGGSASIAIRSAVTRYRQAKRMSMKEAKGLLLTAARRNKKDTRAAKKKLKELEEEMERAALVTQKDDKSVYEAKVREFQNKMLDLFKEFGVDTSEKNKLYRKYIEWSGNMVKLYLFADVAVEVMNAARAGYGGGKFTKRVTRFWENLGEKLDAKLEGPIKKMPGWKILLNEPIAGWVVIPKKMVDVIRTKRTAKRWTRTTEKRIIGQVFFGLGTKKKGRLGQAPLEYRWWMRGFRRIFENPDKREADGTPKRTKVGRFFNSYYLWNFDKYTTMHGIWRRALVGYRNEVQTMQEFVDKILNSELPLQKNELLADLVRADRVQLKLRQHLEEQLKLGNITKDEHNARNKIINDIFGKIQAKVGTVDLADPKIVMKKMLDAVAEGQSHFNTNKGKLGHEEQEELRLMLKTQKNLLEFMSDPANERLSLHDKMRKLIDLNDRFKGLNVDKEMDEFKKFEKMLHEAYGIAILEHEAFQGTLQHGKAKAIELRDIAQIYEFEVVKAGQEIAKAKKISLNSRKDIEEYLASHRVEEQALAAKVNGIIMHLGGAYDNAVKAKLTEAAKLRLAGKVEEARNAQIFFLNMARGFSLAVDPATGRANQKDKKFLQVESDFNSSIGASVRARIMQEFDKHDKFSPTHMANDLYDQFAAKLAAVQDKLYAHLNKEAFARFKTVEDEAHVRIGSDPSGAFLAFQLNKIRGILNNKELEEFLTARKVDIKLTDINQLEMRFSKAADKDEFIKRLADAVEKHVIDPKTGKLLPHDQLLKSLADICGILHTPLKKTGDLAIELEKTIINRAKIKTGLEGLTDAQLVSVCKMLHIKMHEFVTPAGVRDTERLHHQIIERLHMLEAPTSSTQTKMGKIADKLKVDKQIFSWLSQKKINDLADMLKVDKSAFVRSSVGEFMMVSMLERTYHEVQKWSAETLKAAALLRPHQQTAQFMAESPEELTKTINKKGLMQQQIEYASLRREHLANQYQGSQGQHIETLLFGARNINKMAEQALVFGLHGAPWGGSILGNMNAVRQHMIETYLAKKAVYQNLIDRTSTLFQDGDFAKALAKRKGWTDAEIEAIERKDPAALRRLRAIAYDADGYQFLMDRGVQVRDTKKGLAYWMSSDNKGAVPLLEYDKAELEKQNRGIILKADPTTGRHLKGDERNYSPLLARFNVSEFAGVQNGLIGTRNVAKDNEPEKLRRIDPSKIPEAQRFSDVANINIDRRNEIATALANSGAIKFVHASDYRYNHAPLRQRATYAAGSAVGIFTLGVFYDHIQRFHEWYAAANRMRDIMSTVGKIAGPSMVVGQNRWNADQFAAQYGLILSQDLNNIDKDRVHKKESLKNADGKEISRASVLAGIIAQLQASHKWAVWRRKNFSSTDVENAVFENAWYQAKLEKKALGMMVGKTYVDENGVKREYLTKDDYNKLMKSDSWKARLSQVSDAMKDFGLSSNSELTKVASAKYVSPDRVIEALEANTKHVWKDNAAYRTALVEMGGSGHNIFGSGRSVVNTFMPVRNWLDASYVKGFIGEAAGAIESGSMRDTRTALGQKIGLEYVAYMGFDTGQGMYENPRHYTTSLWEVQMVPWLKIVMSAHKFFLPMASAFYRGQAGVSSYFFKTELEPGEQGKVKTDPAFLLRLRKGMSDWVAGGWQNISDYSGFSNVVGAMQAGGKVKIDNLGNPYIERSWFARGSKRYSVPSEWVWSSSQIWKETGLQDKVNDADVWKRNEIIHDSSKNAIYYDENGNLYHGEKGKREAIANHIKLETEPTGEYSKLDTHTASRFWVDAHMDYVTSSGKERREAEKRLVIYEDALNPYVVKENLVDYRQAGAKLGTAGKYFAEEGSRYRFMNLYNPNFMNSWMTGISVPGAFEVNPLGDFKELQPRVAAQIDRAKEGTRLSGMKNEWDLHYNEALQDFILVNNSTIHQDALRDVNYYRTPALMHAMKFQSYAMQYEWLNPWIGFVPGGMKLQSLFYKHKRRSEFSAAEKDAAATGMHDVFGAAGIDAGMTNKMVQDNIALKMANYNEVNPSIVSRTRNRYMHWFAGRADSFLDRMRMLQLTSSVMADSNTEEMLKLTLLSRRSYY